MWVFRVNFVITWCFIYIYVRTDFPHKHTVIYTVYKHSLSFVAFLDVFPSTLLKHEIEIDSLGLNDCTADANNCCQHPWQRLGQPNGIVATSFLSNFLTNIFTPLSCCCWLCRCVNVSFLCFMESNDARNICQSKKNKIKLGGWQRRIRCEYVYFF